MHRQHADWCQRLACALVAATARVRQRRWHACWASSFASRGAWTIRAPRHNVFRFLGLFNHQVTCFFGTRCLSNKGIMVQSTPYAGCSLLFMVHVIFLSRICHLCGRHCFCNVATRHVANIRRSKALISYGARRSLKRTAAMLPSELS